MKEALRCVLTFDTAHTLTSQSLSIVGSFIEKLETSYLSHRLSPNCALRNLAGFATKAIIVDLTNRKPGTASALTY